jgi:hypothetical protein
MRTLLAFALLGVAASAAAAPEGIEIQYMDAHGRRPAPAARLIEARPDRGPYSRSVLVDAAPVDAGPESPGKVVLVVDDAVYGGIVGSLSTFQADLESEGYTVEVWQVSGGSAEDIRSDLQDEYAAGGLDGAIVIGDIPAGWLENGDGEYPVDLFLMDMDGSWTDSDGDGLYESASGKGPEIWVGRLTPTYITAGSSVALLNNYFAKNHAYRMGTLTLPDRALAYEEAFTGLTDYLGDLYADVTLKDDPVGTCADDYRAELMAGYEWVHLISHSSPWGSSFHTGAPSGGGGTFDYFEVNPLDPHAFFYVLNCCSNGRWTEVDNLANGYIWTDTYGLAALAQAKVDYTNDFQEYYTALAAGSNLGDAYIAWLDNNLYMEDGAVLFGDPTLKPHGQSVGAAAVGEAGSPAGTDLWLSEPISDGFDSQGRADTYHDPSSGQVFAACGTSEDRRANILATRSDGDSWAEPVIVCEHEYWDWHPTVGGDGQGQVWIAWQSMRSNHSTYDIFLSEWNGSSWEAADQLTSGDPFEVEPSIDGGGGHAWLVWQKWQGTQTDVEGTMWTGSEWTTISAVSDEEGGERHPDVAYGGGRFGLVYQASRDGSWVIAFRDAPDSGPFGDEEIVSASSGEARYPRIDSDGEHFWVTWQNGGGEILCARETSTGWQPPAVVSGTDVGCRPDVEAASAAEATVTWAQAGQTIRAAEYDGGWTAPYSALSADAVDDASLVTDGSGQLWALYGRRGADLQWDLWAGRPDPAGVAGPGSGAATVSLRLLGANPFRSSVALGVAAPGEASLEIYDAAGRLVGDHRVETGVFSWNAAGSGGRTVPAGVYYAVLRAGGSSASLKMVKLP